MVEWLLLTAGLLTLLYWYMTRHYDYWRSKGVFTVPGHLPGIGHYWEVLLLKKSHEWLANEIYQKTKGHPAVGIYAFRHPVLVIRNLDLIKTVTVGEFSSFTDQSISYDRNLDYHIAANPFFLKGKEWKAMRQKISPALTNNRVKLMFPAMKKACQECEDYMRNHLNEDVEIRRIADFTASEMVAKCAFSINGHSFDEKKAEFVKAARHLWGTTIYSALFMLVTSYFPFVNKLTKRKFFPDNIKHLFVTIINQAILYRNEHPETDYLQHLLKLQDKDKGFQFKDVVSLSLVFMLNGIETSSMVATFALYELSLNMDLQEALREEIRSVELSYDAISSLPLLDRVLQETLRMYGEFAIIRACTKDTILQSGDLTYPVYKGQKVIIPLYSIHRDPEIYPDPDKFDPDRFLQENIAKRHPMTRLWFGAGPRTCLGQRFAKCQVKMILANIVAKCRVLPCVKTAGRPQLSPKYLLPVVDNALWARFEPL